MCRTSSIVYELPIALTTLGEITMSEEEPRKVIMFADEDELTFLTFERIDVLLCHDVCVLYGNMLLIISNFSYPNNQNNGRN